MLQEDINNLSLSELMDLLVKNTLYLLELMNKKDADNIILHDARKELQLIQKAIENKKSNKLKIAL